MWYVYLSILFRRGAVLLLRGQKNARKKFTVGQQAVSLFCCRELVMMELGILTDRVPCEERNRVVANTDELNVNVDKAFLKRGAR